MNDLSKQTYQLHQRRQYNLRRAIIKKGLMDLGNNQECSFNDFRKTLEKSNCQLEDVNRAKNIFTQFGEIIPVQTLMDMINFKRTITNNKMILDLGVEKSREKFGKMQSESSIDHGRSYLISTDNSYANSNIDKSCILASQSFDNAELAQNSSDSLLKLRKSSKIDVKKNSRHQRVESASRLSNNSKQNLKTPLDATPKYPGTYEDDLLKLVSDLNHANIPYKYVFRMLQILMEILNDNEGSVDRKEFENASKILKTSMGPKLYDRMLDISLDQNDRINCRLLSKLVDHVHYCAPLIKKSKNSSEQFKKHSYSLTTTSKDRIFQNYKILAKRIEEKFKTMTKAYRFFDTDKENLISLTEFKAGLDTLCVRFTDSEIRDLFNLLDRKKDGFLDHDEFCEILEERKLLKGKIDIDYDPVTGKEKKLRKGPINPHVSYIDSGYSNGAGLHGKNNDLESFITLEHRKQAKYNPIIQKTEPGATKLWGYELPDPEKKKFFFGKKTEKTDYIKDIISNSFQREWAKESSQKKQKETDKKKSTSPLRFETDTNILRTYQISKNIKTNNSNVSPIPRSKSAFKRPSISRQSFK